MLTIMMTDDDDGDYDLTNGDTAIMGEASDYNGDDDDVRETLMIML